MGTTSKYKSKKPDENGYVDYSKEEHDIWSILMSRQMPLVKKYACDEFKEGLDILKLSNKQIPQIPYINERLEKATGWNVAPVPALIGFGKFFDLLANKKFPAATFIRTKEELNYLQEPDIFHEIFGHCPMLTNQIYADFTQKYGELGLKASEKDQIMLARFYWFTVEFGLIKTSKGVKAYGGGILSSIEETPYAIDSDIPARKSFDPLEIFRTPYRIDILQTVYYVINNYKDVYDVLNQDVFSVINEARRLGMLDPTYPLKKTGS